MFVCRHVLYALLLACSACSTHRVEASTPQPPAPSVLVIANEAFPAESGTDGQGASLFVAEHYLAARNIPRENLLQINIPLVAEDPRALENENISWETFNERIRIPLQKWLSSAPNAEKIRTIVPVYGVPVRFSNPPGTTLEGLSVDSYIATIRSNALFPRVPNPFFQGVGTEERMPFEFWENPGGWQLYIVSRLDGPSASVAASLVDKALEAETSLTKSSGIGYFDYQHRPCCGDLYNADQSVLNAYRLSTSQGFESYLNDQSLTGSLLRHAPDALWVWSWYSVDKVFPGYDFVPGAVGAHLASFTAHRMRTIMDGSWVPYWLNQGITATWGATAEPYAAAYIRGDALLRHFWRGRSFGESCLLANPSLNWMMTCVGDPLYAPHIFKRPAGAPPEIYDVKLESRLSPIALGGEQLRSIQFRWKTNEPTDTQISVKVSTDEKEREVRNSALTTAHMVTLHDVPANTPVTYSIRARDPEGNLTVAEVQIEQLAAPKPTDSSAHFFGQDDPVIARSEANTEPTL